MASHLHHRRSVRLPDYNYTGPGAYFVTIVTQDRACLFGHIDGGEMQLSPQALIVDECSRLIPDHFPNAELGAYVVMPNHVHGIIVLHDRSDDPGGGLTAARRGTPWRAPTPTVHNLGTFRKTRAGVLSESPPI